MGTTTKGYSTVEGKEADLGRYNRILKQMQELANELLDAAPVEQYGQVERAELMQELVAASRVEFDEDVQVVYNIHVA
jgi:SAM-dependent MidA family methyltransferase